MYKVLGMVRNCVAPLELTICSGNKMCLKKISIASVNFEKWDLMSAISLERKPIITKDLNEIEHTFYKVLSEIEYERSSKSDHEIKKEMDKIRADQFKKGDMSIQDVDMVVQQTAQDLEDSYKDELKAFKTAERLTEADVSSDTKSTNRILDQTLLFVVKQKIGNNFYWILPHDVNKKGETMRQTAERALKEYCGDKLKTRFLGNAPCGFYKYRYPQKVTNESNAIGAKVFFFKAQLLKGDPMFNKSEILSDYQWVTRNELSTLLINDYNKSVSLFLVDEN